MNRILATITSLEQHALAMAENSEVYRPAACPRFHRGVRIHVVRREGRRAAASADALIDLPRMLDERSRRARAHPLSAGGGNKLGGAELSIQAMTA
jgi:hypothetical protein